MEGQIMVVTVCDNKSEEERDRNFPKELLEEWDRVCAELRRLANKKWFKKRYQHIALGLVLKAVSNHVRNERNILNGTCNYTSYITLYISYNV